MHRQALWVPVVRGVVASGTAQVDAAGERDIAAGVIGVTQHDQLLVVRAGAADPLVEQHLTARGVNFVPELAVLLLAVGERVGVRPPHEPFHDDPAPRGITEQLTDGRADVAQPLVGIAAPVGEEQMVPCPHRLHCLDEPGEVSSSVDQRVDSVTCGPCRQPAGRITAFRRGQKPVVNVHTPVPPWP